MNNSQELAIIIKAKTKEQKKQIKEMLLSCNLSVNTLSSMQSGGFFPRVEALAKIADYLDCSVDYLLGRDEYVQTDLSSEEKELLAAYRSNPDMQQAVNRLLGIAPAEQESKKEPAV